MSWTNTTAFSSYILTYTHGDESVLAGAHRPKKGTAEIAPGGIIIPVRSSGTVENISVTNSTLVANNSLVTLVDFNKRTASHLKPTEWNRFQDDPNFREIEAEGQARDLVEQALVDFYATIVDNGTRQNVGATPSGDVLTQFILQKMAAIKSRARKGKPSKMTIFLNESGAAAFAFSQGKTFNYAPAKDPMFGTFHGADVYTTNDALSGSGTVIGGIFGEFGIAYASTQVQTQATVGDAFDLRTGMHIVTSTHIYGIKALDTNQLYFFANSGA